MKKTREKFIPEITVTADGRWARVDNFTADPEKVRRITAALDVAMRQVLGTEKFAVLDILMALHNFHCHGLGVLSSECPQPEMLFELAQSTFIHKIEVTIDALEAARQCPRLSTGEDEPEREGKQP